MTFYHDVEKEREVGKAVEHEQRLITFIMTPVASDSSLLSRYYPIHFPLISHIYFAPLLPSLRPCNAFAALSFGCASPNPHPPSLSCATTGPAQVPLLNPQQADAQSASDVHAPVMNCVPAAAAGAAAPVLLSAGGAAGAGAAASALAFPPAPFRALLFGCALPKPQPSPRSLATNGAAHFPDVKPQHAEAHSASEAHSPVMNWVPWAAAYRETIGDVSMKEG